MTTQTPATVRYETTASLTGYGALTATLQRASADLDRTAFATATLLIGNVTDALWAALDPRTSAPRFITWRTIQYGRDAGGNEYELGRLPTVASGTDTANMVIRTAVRDHMTATATVTVMTAESLMTDKLRIAAGSIDTGASSVAALTTWAITDVMGGSPSYSYPAIMSSTAIPSGDRRLMQSGDNFLSLIQPELDAIGCRLIDAWGRLWRGIVRDQTEYGILKLSTHTKDDHDASVIEVEETVSREGDWADGVLIKYSPPGGTVTYQRSGAGVNTKGVVVNRERVAPAANAATAMVNRYRARGADYSITARIRFAQIAVATRDAASRQDLQVAFANGRLLIASIRAIEWDFETGLMTIRAQSDTFG